MFFLSASSHLRGEEEATGDWHSRESKKRGRGLLQGMHVRGLEAIMHRPTTGTVNLNIESGWAQESQGGRVIRASVLFAEILEAEP